MLTPALAIASGAGIHSSPSPFQDSLIRFSEALKMIQKTSHGKSLISHAMDLWKMKSADQIASQFKWGDVSRTDTILTRHFNPATGEEEQERETTIYLRKGQTQEALVLDMAHELVHATSRPAVDPYDPGLTPGSYIWNAIEGAGGEVDAVLEECQVGMELATGSAALPSSVAPLAYQRCRHYFSKKKKSNSAIRSSGQSSGNSPGVKIEKEKIRRDFYRVGEWQGELIHQLGTEVRLFPLLSPLEPLLYSGTGHTPYPSALFQEFREITETACQNSLKRMKMISSSELPLSESQASFMQDLTHRFLSKRCR